MTRTNGSVWTKQDEDLLCQLRAQQLTNRDIAERMGRTLASIKSKLERMALGTPTAQALD